MEHTEALQLAAVDKYLLNEMTPQMREEFEEHYFDCQECATDLRATAAFMDSARKELKPRPLVMNVGISNTQAGNAGVISAASTTQTRFAYRWRPAIQTFALAASLLVIAYQNFVTLPGFRSEVAQSEAATVVPSLSLVGVSRGGSVSPLNVGHSDGFVLQVEIPTDDRYTSYDCLLYSPSKTLLLKKEISLQTAKDTVTIAVPPGRRESGQYYLVVNGKISTTATGAGTEVQKYPFVLSVQ